MRAWRRLAGRLSAFRDDERGIVAILAAAFGFCLVGALALAIDLSSFFLARRSDQGALDLASIAAARNIVTAEASARQVLAANGYTTPKSLKVTLGHYDPDAKKTAQTRFIANGLPTNAVKLEMTTAPQIYFSRALFGATQPTIGTRSIAANTRVASFSIGSRLASLDGGLANTVLSKLLGAQLSLTAMDYNSLANVQVDMPDLLSRLAPKVGVTAGTYDDVLSTTPTLSQVSQALSETPGLPLTARAALQGVATAGSNQTVDLRQMINLGPFAKLAVGASTKVTATASALDILSTAIGIASGSRQVDVDLGTQVPGVLGLTLSIVVGERPQSSPWLAIGAENVTVSTAQMRLRLNSKIGGVLGLGSLSLPVAIDLAAGTAKLSAASCGRNPRTDGQATLAVTPAVAELWVGEPKVPADWLNLQLDPDIKPATVADVVLVLTATASSHVAAANMQPTSVTFSATDIASASVKTVDTSNLLQSTLGSLTGNLTVSVVLKPLGVTLGTPTFVQNTLRGVLSPVGAALDPTLNSVLNLLGVSLGQADVTVRGLRCDGSALVN